MDNLIQLIGNYGFPIVACIFIGWYVKYTNDKNREQLEKLQMLHREEVSEMTKAINNNTLVIQKLVDRMEGSDDINE